MAVLEMPRELRVGTTSDRTMITLVLLQEIAYVKPLRGYIFSLTSNYFFFHFLASHRRVRLNIEIVAVLQIPDKRLAPVLLKRRPFQESHHPHPKQFSSLLRH